MRLIDADALVAEIVKIDDLRKLSTATIGKALDAVPTIDAIPVEWLRKWPKDLREGAYVRDILQDWQQEQEAQDVGPQTTHD